jgi:hypothetical protein
MHAALTAVPAATDAFTLPLVLTVAIATVALVVIAVYVRRARRSHTLTGVTALASGVSAAGVLVSALVIGVAFGSATAATAAPLPAHELTSTVSGYQLPTK